MVLKYWLLINSVRVEVTVVCCVSTIELQVHGNTGLVKLSGSPNKTDKHECEQEIFGVGEWIGMEEGRRLSYQRALHMCMKVAKKNTTNWKKRRRKL